ncbi:hypothetical protein [Bacillus sp. SA1-12]|uniref:hypothetical protein n=1 Tax=Bacillus sp. SA1-12 TaxID=1455638 RepID=UPI000A734829|nr:hypothetical protein [Bacillus sp. SA1-12]
MTKVEISLRHFHLSYPEFDENGQVESTTTYNDGSMTTVEPETNPFPVLDDGGKYEDPSRIPVTEPGLSYSLIDTFTGSSKYLDTLNEWVYQFGAALIPGLLTKNVWAGAAGSASWNTFLKPSATKYYKTWIYETSDHYYLCVIIEELGFLHLSILRCKFIFPY